MARTPLKKFLVAIALPGIILSGSVSAKTAKKKVITKPNYIYREGGVYYYEAAITAAEKAEGKVASDAVGYRFYGKNQDGEYILVQVSGGGAVIETAYCKNPCRVIRFGDGTRLVNEGRLLVGSAIADAIKGRMVNTNPELTKPKRPIIKIPSRAPIDNIRAGDVARNSTGIIIRSAAGVPVYATADGVVKFIGTRVGYGRLLIIDHGGGEIESIYGNLGQIIPAQKLAVSKGELIGFVAAAPAGREPSLIYEVRIANVAVNPIPYLISSDAEFRRLFGAWPEK